MSPFSTEPQKGFVAEGAGPVAVVVTSRSVSATRAVPAGASFAFVPDGLGDSRPGQGGVRDYLECLKSQWTQAGIESHVIELSVMNILNLAMNIMSSVVLFLAMRSYPWRPTICFRCRLFLIKPS